MITNSSIWRQNMISAKLIKALEGRGVYLELPGYDKIEEAIIEILKNNNPRLNLSLPLFLNEKFDYHNITASLNSSQKKELAKSIIISEKIYRKEKIENNLKSIIKKNKINAKFSNKDFEEYYQSFKEAILIAGREKQEIG